MFRQKWDQPCLNKSTNLEKKYEADQGFTNFLSRTNLRKSKNNDFSNIKLLLLNKFLRNESQVFLRLDILSVQIWSKVYKSQYIPH